MRAKQTGAMDKNELFEKLLEETGGWGRFQTFILFLSLILSSSCAFNHLSSNFTAYSPPFSCSGDRNGFNTTCSHGDTVQRSCRNIVFDQIVMRRTIVTDYKLICERASLITLSNSTYMAGAMVLNLLAGFLADHFGRRRVLLSFCCVHVISSYATAFTTSYWQYISIRLLVGGTIHGAWSTAFIMMNEFSIISRRGLVAAVFSGGWNVGSMIMIGIAYLLKDWVQMQQAFAIFSTSSIVFYFFMPETPRWLLLNGKNIECDKVYRTLAVRNGVNLQNSQFEETFKRLCKLLHDEREATNEEYTKSLFEDWISYLMVGEYRKRLLLLMVPWFTVGTAAYGIHFSVSLVGFDIFLVSVLKDILIIVTLAVGASIYDKVYRSPLMLFSYLTGGLMALSILFIPDCFVLTRVATYMIAQGFIVASFSLVCEMTTEIVSTDARSTTYVVLDAVSKFGTALSPFVVLLGGLNPDIPQAVFGGLMIVGSLAFLFTQETKGQPLKQTVQDLQLEEKRTIAGYLF